MVAGDLVALPAPLGRPLDDVDSRTVVALHVEIAGGEAGWFPVVQVAGDRKRLEKNLRHYHRAAQIQDDAAFVKRRQ